MPKDNSIFKFTALLPIFWLLLEGPISGGYGWPQPDIRAIPLAAGVLFSFGLLLTPAVGAVLMSLSTLIVAANAQLLRRTKVIASGVGNKSKSR
jgi:hypothetical protein